jgi:polyisoprenoid-binding protein YceI
MTQTLAVRAEDVPAGPWHIDPRRSSVWVVARHLVVQRVWGQFRRFAGTITVNGHDPLASSAEAVAEVASLTTGDPVRDRHLLSPDFLDADRHPLVRFRSAGLEGDGPRYELTGELTLRGVTRPVRLELELLDLRHGPEGSRLSLRVRGEVDRRDFRLTWSPAIETGGAIVGPVVGLELDLEAVRS